MTDLYNAVSNFDQTQAKRVKEYSGLLGLTSESESPNVPNRNGYVYVRFRDNQSEIVQAYNEMVSPVTNLPVVVVRKGTGWYIKGRDVDRYNNWGSSAAFMPAHHYQHEFNPDSIGGDIVFVYPQAFVPLLVTPSGTDGGPNVVLQQISFKKDNGAWLQAGVTGTQSILVHKPTDGTAIIGLVYLNRDTGNPGFFINSGSSPASSVTGTHALLQYLPSLPSTDYEPLAMVRIVSGTSSVGWPNLYDIRQFFGGSVSGTGGGGVEEAPIDGKIYGRKDAAWAEVSGTGGGTTNPAGSDKQVQYNQSNAFGASSKFTYDYSRNVLIIGDEFVAAGIDAINVFASGVSPSVNLWTASNNSAINGFIKSYRYRGSFDSPVALDQFDELLQIRAAGYNGTNLTATAAEILFDVPYDWASGSHPSRIGLWVTASGSATLQDVFDVEVGRTYFQGSYTDVTGAELETLTNGSNASSLHQHDREVLTSDRTYYVRTDGNDSFTGLTNASGTASGAFLTIQKAVDTATALDLSIYDVTIQLGDGTYTAYGLVNGPFVGSGNVTIQGNNATPTNVVISLTAPGNTYGCINALNNAAVIVKDLQVQTTTNGYGLLAGNGGAITFQNVVFAACGTGHIRAYDGGYVTATGNYSITGSTTRHWFSTSGIVRIQNITVTLTGTPAFSSAFADATMVGALTVNAITFSGGATGARYSATMNGVIFTNGGGATYLPGNAVGSTATGGQYT